MQGVKISIKESGTIINHENSIDITPNTSPNTASNDMKTRTKESDIYSMSQNGAPDKVINEKQFVLKGGIFHNFGKFSD